MTPRLADSLRRLRHTMSVVSPRRRRWDRFLRSLPLDPARLPRPIAAPGDRDFIICGSPRSGTTLAAAMLFQPPLAVTVMEPWDGMRMPPGPLFASLRQEIDSTGQLRRGRLNVEALRSGGRVEWCREGARADPIAVRADYRLGVKWPAYWRLLDLLPETRFIVCLRDPYETIGSYKTAGGRLAMGLNYDTAFNREMNAALRHATGDEVLRRILLYDYIHARILPHLTRPNVFALRYERWFTQRDAVMRELSAFLGVPLGPGLPVLRPPRGGTSLDSAEAALIAARCTAAAALGYASPGRGPIAGGPAV